MHYCIHLYTRAFPTDDMIDLMLEPYYEYHVSEENEEEPPFKWDFRIVGGRYNGRLLLDASKKTDERYQWTEYTKERRAGRLFRSMVLEQATVGILEAKWNKIDEDLALQAMGIREGVIHVDGAWLPDVTNRYAEATECFAILTDDGTVIARSVWNRQTHEWDQTPDFNARARLVMERLEADHYLTVIDAHT